MKLILTGFAALILTLTGLGTTSQAPAQPVTEPVSNPTPNPERVVEPPAPFINDIEVPFEVVMYVQDKYQGLAVIGVQKVTRGGQEVYRLRVDRDDDPNSYEGSFHLFYTLDWQLIGEEAALPPPPPPPPPPAPAPVPEPTPAPAPAPPPEPEGGRGGGPPPEDTDPPEPDEEPGGGDEEPPDEDPPEPTD